MLLARKGAHIVVADQNVEGVKSVADEVAKISSSEDVAYTPVDLSSAESIKNAGKFTVLQFGGLDAIVITAAIYPVPGADGEHVQGG